MIQNARKCEKQEVNEMSKGLKSKLSKLRHDGAITDSEYQKIKKALDDKPYKAMVIWSDGCEVNTSIFEDKDKEKAIAAAREHMHKEYDDHGNPNEEAGSYKGDFSCQFIADDEDACIWDLIVI